MFLSLAIVNIDLQIQFQDCKVLALQTLQSLLQKHRDKILPFAVDIKVSECGEISVFRF